MTKTDDAPLHYREQPYKSIWQIWISSLLGETLTRRQKLITSICTIVFFLAIVISFAIELARSLR